MPNKLATAFKGTAYTIAGAAAGLVTGVCGTIAYLALIIEEKLPNSMAQVDVSVDTKNLTFSGVVNCIQNQGDNCVPIETHIIADNWTVPMVRGSVIMTSVGAAAGLGLFGLAMYRKYQRENQGYITLPQLGSDIEAGLPGLDSPRRQSQ